MSTTTYETVDAAQARQLAERLTERGFDIDLARDPSNPARHRVVASFEGDAPDVADILAELSTVKEA